MAYLVLRLAVLAGVVSLVVLLCAACTPQPHVLTRGVYVPAEVQAYCKMVSAAAGGDVGPEAHCLRFYLATGRTPA